MTGPCTNTLTIKHGKRQTIADAYLTPALDRPNLTLLQETEVQTLSVERGRCTGILAQTKDGAVTLNADRIIVATGSIASPCLLMRSGIGPADDLKALGIPVAADLPGVGQNLHDHLLSGGNVYRAKRPVPPSQYQNSESLMYLPRNGATSDSGAGAPEMVLACVIAPVATEQFTAPPFGEAYTVMFGFTHPKSRGTIRLASADAKAPPLIDPNYLADPYDRDVYLDALDTARAVGAARALADWRGVEVLPGLDIRTTDAKRDFLEKAAFTHHHPVGTCRMGEGRDAVVDCAMNVQGIEGLSVCDASVIPSITTGPVNAAIVAIAERYSDLLKGKPPLAPFMPEGMQP
jgi:choline dehydrogenase-like flavoprotein